MYITPNGTTVAVNGEDIIAVASPPGVGEGITAVQWAIDNGGHKLDSYESNYGLYRKLGFKTVSYTPFKKGINPYWKEGRDKPGDIIFMILGGTNGKGAKGEYNKSKKEYNHELQTKVKPKLYKGEDTPGSEEWESSGYYKAQKVRDEYMEKHKKRYNHK